MVPYLLAMRVLILGGTSEARALAAELDSGGWDVMSSLAGRVARPRLPAGAVRIGGFGGVEGLAAYLESGNVAACVDATHPFAVMMSSHAVQACSLVGVPLIRFVRPGWGDSADATGWHWVTSFSQAREAAESLGDRPFVTTGRQTLAAFSAWSDREVLVRVVEPLDGGLPASWKVVLDRGPYEQRAEEELLSRHAIDVLLTKDSGGSYTRAKLDAARELGVPVVIVARPGIESGALQAPSVSDVVAWLQSLPASR